MPSFLLHFYLSFRVWKKKNTQAMPESPFGFNTESRPGRPASKICEKIRNLRVPSRLRKRRQRKRLHHMLGLSRPFITPVTQRHQRVLTLLVLPESVTDDRTAQDERNND